MRKEALDECTSRPVYIWVFVGVSMCTVLKIAVCDFAAKNKFILETLNLHDHAIEFVFQHLRCFAFKIDSRKIEVWKLGKLFESTEINSVDEVPETLAKRIQRVECRAQDYSMFSLHEKLDYIVSWLSNHSSVPGAVSSPP